MASNFSISSNTLNAFFPSLLFFIYSALLLDKNQTPLSVSRYINYIMYLVTSQEDFKKNTNSDQVSILKLKYDISNILSDFKYNFLGICGLLEFQLLQRFYYCKFQSKLDTTSICHILMSRIDYRSVGISNCIPIYAYIS